MLNSDELRKAKSPSKTYIIPVYSGSNYSEMKFKKFVLPDEYEKHGATWYFYNKLDFFSCGGSAFPYEMFCNVETIERPFYEDPEKE